MTLFATLITNPAATALDDELVRRVSAEIGADAPPDWLAPGIAVELRLEQMAPPEAIERDIRRIVADAPVDVAVLPGEARRKRLLVADMDSTIIGQECIDELADFAGLKAEIAAITERAMRGELPFEETLRQRVALLKEVPEAAISTILSERITITPGASALVRTMKMHGAFTALVSGGFTAFTSEVARRVGFDVDVANTLVIEDGRLAGRCSEPIRGREAKREALERLRQTHGASPSETLAVGDGANDLSMIAAAGLGVAFHAKPSVAEAARVRIDHGDLTALLYLQGYRREEFAT